LHQTGGAPPHRAILGCTHFPIVADRFRHHLPPFTRLLSQPEVVADSLEDYLARHGEYLELRERAGVRLLTTGDVAAVSRAARVFWPDAPEFESA
jgi:glutamate racemase